jgi:predicted tellurium resistance membrane protein TerC
VYTMIKVFLLNLINDIDNGLILASLLKRFVLDRTRYVAFAFYAAVILTFTRTCYIFIEKNVTELPGLRLVSGIILLWISVKMAISVPNSPLEHLDKNFRSVTTTSKKEEPQVSPVKHFLGSMTHLFILLIATDFAICLDTVIMTAELSDNAVEIVLGIFFSLFLVLLFFRRLITIFLYAPWIHIIIAGFLTQIAVMGMSHDPVVDHVVKHIQMFFMDTQGMTTSKIMDILALDTAIVVIIIAILRRSMKNS